MKLPMSVPVLTMRAFSGFCVGPEQYMMFFVRERHPPKPLNKSLRIERWPSMKIWVK